MGTTSMVLFALLAQLSPPSSDPRAKAEAQGMLTEGSALYDKSNYAGALDKFNAAYALYPSPKLMFNIGQANRDLGRPVEAVAAFEKFLAGALDASPATIAEARTSLVELREKLGRLRIDCETVGAEVSVDGKSAGLTPMLDPIWVTPGRHQVTASHGQTAPALAYVEVTSGPVQTVSLRLGPVAILAAATPASTPEAARDLDLHAAPRPITANEGWWLGRTWTWVAAGSTALLAAGAISAGLSMQSKYDSLNASCGSTSPSRLGCSESDIHSVSARGNLANVLWGLTGAAAVTTGVLFYFEGRPVAVVPVAGETIGALARVGF